MVSFSSSINKSKKKFAPKAPVRRAAAVSKAPSTATPSVDRQASQTPQPAVSTAPSTDASNTIAVASNAAISTPAETHPPEPKEPTQSNVLAAPNEPTIVAPEEKTKPSSSETPTPIPTPIPTPHPKRTAPTPVPTPKSILKPSSSEKPTPILIPQPKRQAPTPIPTPKSILKPSSSERPTPIPIPQPKRKDSTPIPTPIPIPRPSSASSKPLPPPTVSPQRKRPLEETTPLPSADSHDAPTPANKRARQETIPAPAEHQDKSTSTPDDSVQSRPTKWRKTSETVQPGERGHGDAIPPPKAPGPRNKQASKVVTGVNDVAEGSNQSKDNATVKKVRKPTKPRKTQTAEETAAMIVDDAVDNKPRARKRKRRASTPENAESIEIAPSVVKMSDLCKDLQTGRKSKREVELRNMDRMEAERKQKGLRKRSGESVSKETIEDALAKADEERDRAEAEAQAGPQMRIVNGEIVLDSSSLQIDRHAKAAKNAEDMEEVEENPLTRRINAASFGKRSKSESWDEEMTDLFYRGLRMFGTDFMMISNMFPGRTRRQIKLKFGNEERKDPERIKETLLGPRETVDMAAYSEMTNTIYDDPKIIQQELDEEKKRIEEEHAKEKEAQEELLRNPSGITANGDASGSVLPSIENGAEGKPKKSRKRGQDKKFGGGTEEVLGLVEDET